MTIKGSLLMKINFIQAIFGKKNFQVPFWAKFSPFWGFLGVKY